eukprot:1185920-Prymnesium_polylepis.1
MGSVGGEPQCTQRVLYVARSPHGMSSELNGRGSGAAGWTSRWGSRTSPQRHVGTTIKMVFHLCKD